MYGGACAADLAATERLLLLFGHVLCVAWIVLPVRLHHKVLRDACAASSAASFVKIEGCALRNS